MSETSTGPVPHKPGVYVKDGEQRVATTPARAVALVFNGYVRQAPVPPAEDTDYRDLQTQAKELDIPANQSADVLRQEIDAKLAEDLKVNEDSSTLETKNKPVPTPPKS